MPIMFDADLDALQKPAGQLQVLLLIRLQITSERWVAHQVNTVSLDERRETRYVIRSHNSFVN